MSLKSSYPSEADIPADHKPFYKQEGAEWVLDAEGMVPAVKLDEFRTNNRSLARERDEILKPKLKVYEDTGSIEEFQRLKSIADQLDEGKLVKSGKLDEAVEKRVTSMRSDLEKKAAKAEAEKLQLEARLSTLMIDNAAQEEATKLGAKPTALPDIVARIRSRFKVEEGKVIGFQPDGVTRHYGKSGDGLTIAEVLTELIGQAPHLWEENRGLNAEPGKQTSAPRSGAFTGPNPWKKESQNLTMRMKIAKEQPELAKRLRGEAGIVEVGA